MVVLERYPQLSETYVQTELRYLWPRHDVHIISVRPADIVSEQSFPFIEIGADDEDAICNEITSWRPDVLHTHYLHQAPLLSRLAQRLRVPFTLRSHSYDVLKAPRDVHARTAELVNDRWCLGAFVFPFAVPILIEAGFDREKLYPSFPVIDFDRFYDDSPNIGGTINVGAALPKKSMGRFIDFAASQPHLEFSLYAIGYEIDSLRKRNADLGSPVTIATVQHDVMPGVYKNHRWLLYTACPDLGTVGWPLAVAEAQASGLGVCIENIRGDLRQFLGPSGFLLESLEEASDLLARPPSEESRQAGFDQARRSDAALHVASLGKVWLGSGIDS